MSSFRKPVEKRHLLLAGLWLLLVLAFSYRANPLHGGPGMTWDEAYYYPTYVAVGEWTRQLFTHPGAALSAEGITAGWGEISELPPVTKWLGALCLALPGDGWWRIGMMRLFPAAAHVTSLLLLYLIVARRSRIAWGMMAALAFALHPIVQGHAQIAATETLFITVTLFAIWCAAHDLQSLRWQALLVLACGLALATKVNGIILVAAVVFWLLTKDFVAGRGLESIRRNALLAALIVVLAPIVALAIWPWMWHDTATRLYAYYTFIREHSHQGVWYLGRKWNFGGPPAPITYPFVMAHLMTPLVLLLLFWVGLGAIVVRAVRRHTIAPGVYLALLLTIAPLAAASLPGAPKYDGVRLFLPMFAPAAIVLVAGMRIVTAGLVRRFKSVPEKRGAIFKVTLTIAILMMIALLGTQTNRIDSYNLAVMAATRNDRIFPFERTYWGNALDKECIDGLNAALPPGARLKTLALQPAILTIYQELGVLRSDILINPDPPYDAHLLQNRRGFWGNAEWWLYNERKPLATWGGNFSPEPLLFLYDGRPPGE